MKNFRRKTEKTGLVRFSPFFMLIKQVFSQHEDHPVPYRLIMHHKNNQNNYHIFPEHFL